MRKRGVFIAFEGLDGSGKTTQTNAICNLLQARGAKFQAEREPSDGSLGVIARDTVKRKLTLPPQALALLFAADRYEHVLNVIEPRLNEGVHILTDRFVFSSLAYQGMDCAMEDLMAYNRRALELLTPELTVFVDVDPTVCLDRITRSRADIELFDHDGAAVRENFYKAFKLLEKSSKVLIIDGNRPQEAVTGEIWRNIAHLFEN